MDDHDDGSEPGGTVSESDDPGSESGSPAAEPADAASESEDPGSGVNDADYAVLLDVMPQGKPGDERPQHRKSPVAYALGEAAFGLYELDLTDDADVSVGDRVRIAPAGDSDVVERSHEVSFEDLTSNARNELEYAVEAIVDADERRFVDFYNEAGPITLRLHQLNLLPGIGKKLRNNVLDQRKRGPFESFEDLSERVSGLHRPREVIVERIMEELQEDDLKYQTFVGRES